MKIESSSISMSSQYSYVEKSKREETLRTWTGFDRPVNEVTTDTPGFFLAPEDSVDLSEEGKARLKEQLQTGTVEKDDSISFELSERDKRKIIMIQKMLEAITGKKIKFLILDKIKLEKGLKEGSIKINTSQPQAAPLHGWGLEYDLHESYYEKQTMSFNAGGSVKTSDGREINFTVNLNMSREFASRTDISIRAGDAVKMDPLVINFGSATAGLSEKKYSFDLDNDGTLDQISFVTGGSGFLALDLNNDSIINNGSELFGPQSGNGFHELSKYDSDNNGWIDENDAIYEKLRIWTKDENGEDKLLALGMAGVGAIYLGHVDTQFALKDSSNKLMGEIAKTGVFLRENGTAGTIQHIDLAI